MGYGNPYLASGMSKEIGNNLTQDPDAAYRYVGKLNAQKHDSGSWKMDKLCDGRSNDSTGLGHWLDGGEEVQETDLDASEGEGEKQSTEEEKYNADEEDRFSTEEEEAKYVEEFDSSTEGTARESGDEERAPREETFLLEPNCLAPSWLEAKIPTQSGLTSRRKLLWDGGEDRGLGSGEGWPSSSSREAEHSVTESEEESGVELRGKKEDTSTESPNACPVLCFDEYGNLMTSYQNPNGDEKPGPAAALPTPQARTEEKPEPALSTETPTNSPSPKALRSRTKVSPETTENAVTSPLSEQELRQAFKEEYNTAATSRYGRARKRKTVDGFFFGTINFNELRKITSGSPKKASKGGSKNNSPDQKVKAKEEARPSLPAGPEIKSLKDLNQNGIEIPDSHPINGEVEAPTPPLEAVQMDQAKESTFTVQNKEPQAKENPAGRRRSAASTVASATLTTAITRREGAKPKPAQEGTATSKATTTAKSVDSSEFGIAGTSQRPPAPRRARNQRRRRTRASVDSAAPWPRRPFRSLRLAAAQASQVAPPPPPLSQLEANQHLPISLEGLKEEPSAEEPTTVKEEPLEEELVSVKSEPLEEDGQLGISDYTLDMHSDGQEMSGPTRRSTSRRASDAKPPEEKASSITKSGRIIKKPQLMDISNEAKRQKETREQQRLNEALISSSLEEELALSSVDMHVLEKENPCQHMVGDLVWVHIRGSPLWPSMITYDPALGQYSRVATKLAQMTYTLRGVRLYHVQFFSDNFLTHWIAPSSIIPFEGFDKLKEYLLDLKAKMREMRKHKRVQCDGLLKTLVHMNKVQTGQKHERWMKAINEANVALEMDRYERIQKYAVVALDEKSDPTGTQHTAKLSSRGHRGPRRNRGRKERKRGRPRKTPQVAEATSKLSKTSEDSTDGEFSGFDENNDGNKCNRLDLTFRLHRKGEFMAFAQQHLDAFMLENPGIAKEAALSKLRWRWRRVTQGSRRRGVAGKRKHQRVDETLNGWDDEDVSSGSSGIGGLAKRQRMEEDGGRGVYKVVRNEKVCCRCEGVSQRGGSDIVRCKGLCCGVFHLNCLGLASMPPGDFKCEECLTERHPCFVCKVSSAQPVHRCTVPHCGKFYHDACIQRWPQVYKQRQQEKFVCPRHICHMCAANADDIGDSQARTPPFSRCLRCPTTYHTGEDCLAAGTEEVSQSSHICTKHLQLPKNISHHVNVNWCFCCSKGGSLLLCDQCPAAFHAECMKITAPEGGYVCEDCENGKFPMYGDVVWVKLGLYRWWPGQVLHPRFIPDNIENLPHQQGMFCVHFFGSNDYYWVTRGRAFLYQEGDKGSRAQSSRTLEIQFRRALDEALEAYREQKAKKSLQELRWSEKGNLKPPPYIRIDTNRPVGNVRLSKVDLAAVNRCDCEPNSDNPCGSDEKCLNRMLMFECMREVCGAGDRCGNQRFQKKKYPHLSSFRTEDRGWGLKTLQDLKKGEFVIEYVGELIDDEEFRRRIIEMHDVKEDNYYFLTIDKDIMIDAGPKGNLARFMNHSCQPNCETQKWTVGGDTRVGLFAIEDIPAGSELTFNYNLQCVGTEKKRCCCGAPNCSGFIGVKVQKTEIAGPKREKGSKRRKKRRRETKLSEDECFRCGGTGALILCDGVGCPKGYHLECLGLDKLPRGKWICPWHHCDECGQWSTKLNRCDFCPNSYCRQHIAGNLQHIPGLGTVCQDHNSTDLETLRGQTGTTAATGNTEARQHHKSDVDSDCGQDSCVSVPPSPATMSRDSLTHHEPEDRQERSVDDPAYPRPAGDATEPPRLRPGREGSRSRSKGTPPPRGCPGGVSGERESQRSSIRVNGLTVQSKAARGVKELDKARHVNEA